ncbi:ABC transporter ATP-binding protein [Bordetella holmesii]|uniref:ABC transporter, ATP-binding protein n=2 Tax=Bordetella holmesii TaxID=35814 RepID=A0A158M7Y6_9BORD|nr:ABC transporter ATP-binding protein [Bordetella holmesii]AHV93801.1 ABC transporter family protein [Bordetella holmesii ATCC 51541]AIT28258.1 ABC transporter family protein [Bordetella holmesii 44057]EWM41046.1 ABC transporter family protein [Bordetella holmesii 35009]EWM42886.1 ABC transporter family protein [Bordetella holmesii 41130]EWM44936.1 ABC transporter family protein [Bordetella holmesii 70147]
MPDLLQLEHIALGYDTPQGIKRVVDDLSLSLAADQIGCLLGESGCGKTTVLRAIAGFEPLRAGRILLDGRVLSAPGEQVVPERRNVGMMFQDYALFPHLTVSQNVAFGLRRLPKDRQRIRIGEMLELVGLAHAAQSYPHEISGGQQQRVALARALAPSPGLLLLDEPFSNLDVDTRERLAFEVREILKATGHTAILVTHNQAEAFAIADRIGIMDKGRIAQWDTPYNLHHAPASDFVRDYIRRETLQEQREAAYARGR